MKASLLVLAATALLGLVAAGCGSSDERPAGEEPAGPELDGREFWSTSVSENGAARQLVEGTRVALRFDGGRVGADAGCNSLGGEYTLVEGELRVSALAMTELGCDPERHVQDDFVTALLADSPRISLEGDTLTLSGATATIELIDRSVADPDRPLVGTMWVASGFIDGEAASSFATDSPATLAFSEQSMLSGFDGCTAFSAPVEIADGSVGGPVDGDGELQFGALVQGESAGCPTPDGYEEAFHRLFETGAAVFTIDGPNLTVLNANGAGVTFVASSAPETSE